MTHTKSALMRQKYVFVLMAVIIGLWFFTANNHAPDIDINTEALTRE